MGLETERHDLGGATERDMEAGAFEVEEEIVFADNLTSSKR